ncbi:ankyrin repeat domain-containing protein [Rickettsiales endosymbiont of Stachyamoeba lipophora]|uniref:ankyrin repeat domain-containing protein n=1 Tax=Rickettsiales endosymbiont of Stachyamoeba lipophora TaxID=2486578 RepID=UPI000F64F93A|nr:ankyrin repeat domain-containing protein [Rickettsiales endosymbiont of Stachyamoeba lipophora]AZL15976.1 ankyrin repeat domain-containing protein [Rickettsiales endosymbiont of Stachyamoeba lipophora]
MSSNTNYQENITSKNAYESYEDFLERLDNLLEQAAWQDFQIFKNEVNTPDPIQGRTLFMIFANNGWDMHLEDLKNLGAEVNVTDDSGENAMHLAARKGNSKVINQLIKLKANIDSKAEAANGNTPLFLAVTYGYIEIAKILRDNGAKINIQNNDGDTALMYLIRNAERNKITVDTIKNIITELKPDVTITNKVNKTALDIAKERGWSHKEGYKSLMVLLKGASLGYSKVGSNVI